MPEFPNVPFTDGSEYTAELAYKAFYCPIFDGNLSLLGHREPIRDDELSPTGIKADVGKLQNGFRCAVVSGLLVSYTAGTYLNQQGNLVTSPSGSVVVPDNTTSYIYINNVGQVQASVLRSVLRVTLAEVVAVGGTITSLTDYRHPSTLRVQPASFIVKSFGGQSTVNKVCTQGEVLRGLYEVADFSIPAGVTVTVSKFAKIVCSGNVVLAGTANVTTQTPGAITTSFGLQTVGGIIGFYAGEGLGKFGDSYHFTQQMNGSGGGLGYIVNRPGNSASYGYLVNAGDGGGALVIEAAGVISVQNSSNLVAKGTNGSQAGSTDTGTTYSCIASGSGGGSGGLIYLASATSINVAVGATVDVRGGNGGNGYISAVGYGSALFAAPGRPGSGGYFVTIAPTVNTTGFTFLNAGGSFGNYASLNGAVTTLNATQFQVVSTTFGVTTGGHGAGFAGDGGRHTQAVVGSNTVYTLVPASPGVHHVAYSLPTS